MQVIINERNLAEVQAEYDGPGAPSYLLTFSWLLAPVF